MGFSHKARSGRTSLEGREVCSCANRLACRLRAPCIASAPRVRLPSSGEAHMHEHDIGGQSRAAQLLDCIRSTQRTQEVWCEV